MFSIIHKLRRTHRSGVDPAGPTSSMLVHARRQLEQEDIQVSINKTRGAIVAAIAAFGFALATGPLASVASAATTNCRVDNARCVRHGVFVSPSGSDSAAGTRAHPKRTLAAAIAAAAADHTNVYAAVGTYPEMLDVANGVSVYGGYTSSWRLSSSQRTIITGGFDGQGVIAAAVASGVTSRTTLERLTLDPFPAVRLPFNLPIPSTTSYGLRGIDSGGLRLKYLTVEAAPGTFGLTGSDGAPGQPGGGGQSGQAGVDNLDAFGGAGGAGVPAPAAMWEALEAAGPQFILV